jgi:hypothetical protein
MNYHENKEKEQEEERNNPRDRNGGAKADPCRPYFCREQQVKETEGVVTDPGRVSGSHVSQGEFWGKIVQEIGRIRSMV